AGERDRDAREEERRGGAPLAAPQGETDDQRGGAQRSREARRRDQWQAEERFRDVETERDHRAEGRAACDTQRIGLGEIVAEERLEPQAGNREAGSGEQREEHARQTELPEDRRRRRLAVQHVGQRDPLRPHQRRGDQGGEGEEEQERQGQTRMRPGWTTAHGGASSSMVTGRSPPRTISNRARKSCSRRAACRISAGVPTARTVPPATASRRSPSSDARLRSWVASTTVRPDSALRRRSSAARSLWCRASRWMVGSSRISSSDSCASAAAMKTAWRSPPDSSSTGRSRSSAMPTRRNASATAAKSSERGAIWNAERCGYRPSRTTSSTVIGRWSGRICGT